MTRSVRILLSLAFVLPCSAQDPQLPNFDLTEDNAAAQAVTRYCHDIYDPAFPLLSQDQVNFVYAHRGDIDGDVRTCASWFDVKRIAADRKIAMRYCLVNHDVAAGASAKAAYDACMNQHDVLTALCTQELKNRSELNRKKGFDSADAACPGVTPSRSEYYVARKGGAEDMGHFVVPAAGPGLPAILQAPLPKGLLASGKRLDETVPASASSARSQAPGSVPAAAGNACSFLTRPEAESILGESVDGKSNTDNHCWFVSVGSNAARRKQVQLSVNRSASPDANAVNATRAVLARESERVRMNVRDVDLGDAAIWSWSPGYGTLHAFKGGTIAVVVTIGGLAEDAALQQAKKLAAGPLGGAGKSGYAYAAPPSAAEARAAATTVQSPASYRDTWMAQTRIVRGTVSRVSVKFGGRPFWLTIFFKESPDAAFVVCSPSPDMFRETIGDLYALVGKTLEVTGEVESSMCAGKAASIRVVDSQHYRVQAAAAHVAGRPAAGALPPERRASGLASSTGQRARVGLDICNGGKVDLDALLVKQGSVASTHLAPRDCAHVYEEDGAPQAYVGLAFVDAQGQWGTARRQDLLPDFGLGVLNRANQSVPVRHGNTTVSLPMQLLFQPRVPKCTILELPSPNIFATAAERARTRRFKTVCDGLDYTLNAVAYPDTREVTFEKKCFECPHAPALTELATQQVIGTLSTISPEVGRIMGRAAAQEEEQALKESLEGPPEFQRMNWNEMNAALAKVRPSGGRPEEMPEFLIIRGTVSRVDVSPPGASWHWVNVYFRESPEQASTSYETVYGAFDVCTTEEDIFRDMFGPEFRSRMIGQVLEVQGDYSRAYCKGWKGGIRVSLAHQVHMGAAIGSTAAATSTGTATPAGAATTVGTTANRTVGTVPPAIPLTPASGQIAPPISRRQPPVPMTPTPAVSPQAEFARHYHAVTIRALRAKSGLAQRQQRPGAPAAELPEDVRTARDHLIAQQQAVLSAMSARDNGLAEQRLNDMEDTLKVIEQFLAK